MLEADKKLLRESGKACSWFGSYGIVPHSVQMIGAQNIVEIDVAYGYHVDFFALTYII